jgi:hypothetical protein
MRSALPDLCQSTNGGRHVRRLAAMEDSQSRSRRSVNSRTEPSASERGSDRKRALRPKVPYGYIAGVRLFAANSTIAVMKVMCSPSSDIMSPSPRSCSIESKTCCYCVSSIGLLSSAPANRTPACPAASRAAASENPSQVVCDARKRVLDSFGVASRRRPRRYPSVHTNAGNITAGPRRA